jgi:undecaprenyl diphosphate synthase
VAFLIFYMSKSESKLTHLAIILDGNRRWAKQHGMAEADVYERAGKNIGEVLEAAFNNGVECASIWIGSYANLTARDKLLVAALDRLYKAKLDELVNHPTVKEKSVRIDVIGEWHGLLSKTTVAAAENAMTTTANNDGPRLNVLIGYDGHRERGAAVQQLLKDQPQPANELLEAEAQLRKLSWTGHLPDVDLIIRTGAWTDPHNSAAFLGFLTGESQFSFPEVLWPDFTADMLQDIVDDFLGRERRHGR